MIDDNFDKIKGCIVNELCILIVINHTATMSEIETAFDSSVNNPNI